MAFRYKQISNPVTGQEIKFLMTAKDTKGEYLEMESTYNSKSSEPPPHYHPTQTEDFEIISGQLTVRIDGELKILKEGDTLHIPKRKVHAMWNNSENKAVVNWKVQPSLATEHLLETVMGLATDGKTNRSGVPGLLQLALTARKYSQELRISKPPYPIQILIFSLLTPIAYLLGKRPSYKKYLD